MAPSARPLLLVLAAAGCGAHGPSDAQRALAHARAEAGASHQRAEWSVEPADGPALPGVHAFSVSPMIPDAPGSTVFVTSHDVFCTDEPDAFERLVRILDGGAHPDALSGEAWIALLEQVDRFELVYGTPRGLYGILPPQEAGLQARLAPPSFTRLDGGGFRIVLYFQPVSYPPRDLMSIARAEVVVDDAGAVTTTIAPAFPAEVAVVITEAAGPLSPDAFAVNASPVGFEPCLAVLTAGEAPPPLEVTVTVGIDGAPGPVEPLRGPPSDAPFARCLRETLAARMFPTADAPTTFTVRFSTHDRAAPDVP